MKKTNLTIAITLICILTAPAQAIPLQQEVNDVVSHLVGVMDTSKQASVNPKRVTVRMTTCIVKVIDQPEAIFLYQEQSLAQSLNQPYRQRFLEIKAIPNQPKVESKSFKANHPEAFIGFCDKPENERLLKLNDFYEAGCSVFLKPFLSSIYIGETQAGGCLANVRGAVKITNTVILHSTGMDTWDRGFDAQGNQVWGAKEDSYEYRWINKE